MESDSINFSHAHFPVSSLGYGRRVGIWLQGCSIHCPGCIVPQSWAAGAQHRVLISQLVDRLEPWLARCDGITISGGEPFDQPDALHSLLKRCRSRISGDLLVYSGHTWKFIQRFREQLRLIDVIIPEPFKMSHPSEHPFVGSSNQKLVCLTDLARVRYSDIKSVSRALDAAPAPELIRMAGVPRRNEMQKIVQDLNTQGVSARLRNK